MRIASLQSRLLCLMAALAVPAGKALAQPSSPSSQGNMYRPNPKIRLLEVFDGTQSNEIANDGTIQIAFEYFKLIWPWLIGCASGVAIIWGMYAGVLIMSSGEDSGLRDKGKEHLMIVIKGLVVLALAGLILSTLNPLFYR